MPDIAQRWQRFFLEITNRCNFDCAFCPAGISERPRRDMPSDLALAVIDGLRDLGFADTIYFHVLGEPLLHPDVFAIVARAADAGMRPVLFTNGGALTDDIVRAILGSKAAELLISMQTINQRGYEQLRRTPFDWQTYLTRIQKALAAANDARANMAKVTFRVSMGLKKTDPEHPEDQHFLEYESPDDVRQSMAAIFSRVPDMDLTDAYAELDAHGLAGMPVLQLTDELSLSVKLMGNWRRMWRDTPSNGGRCAVVGKELAVLSDGTVTLCHLDYDGRTALGTVSAARFSDVVTAPQSVHTIDAFLAGRSIPGACRFCRGLKPE